MRNPLRSNINSISRQQKNTQCVTVSILIFGIIYLVWLLESGDDRGEPSRSTGRLLSTMLLRKYTVISAVKGQTSEQIAAEPSSFTFRQSSLDQALVGKIDSNSCKYLPGLADANLEQASQTNNVCKFIKGQYDYAVEGRWLQTCNVDYIKTIGGPIKFAYDRRHIETLSHFNDREPYYMSFGALSREGKPNKSYDEQLRPLSYSWFPAKCNLYAYDRTDMRRQLMKRKLYIVGDSISMELADSIDLLTGLQVAAYKSWTMLDYRTLKPMSVFRNRFCICLETAYSGRVNPDFVSPYTDVEYDKCWQNEYEVEFQKSESQQICYLPPDPSDKLKQHISPSLLGWVDGFDNYDTFVFSIGHHSWKFGELTETYPKIVANMIAWLENKVANENWDGFIIYVSAPMGHADCTAAKDPNEEFQMPINPTSEYDPLDKHNWKKTVALQNLWRDAFERSELLRNRYAYIDLSATYFRSDAHYEGVKGDCLHWMMPGVVDLWSHYLYHIIKELNNERQPS